MIVKESLVAVSAGTVIIQDNKILLAHPTGNKWTDSYSIPKGLLKDGETYLEAAIRETKEEVGIDIDPRDIVSGPHCINYVKKGNIVKKVYYYVVKPRLEIKKKDIKLQKEEVDWAGFLTRDEADNKVFWRLKEVLSHLE